jgi:hypothetical protein
VHVGTVLAALRYTCLVFLNIYFDRRTPWASDDPPKVFRFWLQICQDIQIFMHSALLFINAKFCSVYYPYMPNFITLIMSIGKISFCIFTINAKFFLNSNTKSAYSHYALNFLLHIICILEIFPVCLYVTFYPAYYQHTQKLTLKSSTHSVYYPYKLNFVPHMICTR